MKYLKRANKSQYFLALKQLAVGSLVAQLITIVVSPISTRIYTAEELGIYTLILTITAMFGSVICGRYDLAIVSAENEEEAIDLAVASILFTVLFSIIISIGYTLYLLYNPMIIQELGFYAYIVIPILFFTGLINILTSYNNRNKEYKIISNVYILRTIVQNSGLVVFGLLKLGSTGLLFSRFLSVIFGLKKQSESLLKNREKFKNVKIKNVKNTIKKYKNQPLYSMPAQLINSTSYSMINFFISGLFGLSVFGYYSITYRILGLPLTLISVNVSKIFFQRATEEWKQKGSFNRTLKYNTLFLVILSIPMVIVLILFGPKLFSVVFGENWSVSGEYAKILAPMYGLRLVVSSLSPALIVVGRQKLELFMQCAFVIISLLAYIICMLLSFDITIFLLIVSVGYSIVYIWFYAVIYNLSK